MKITIETLNTMSELEIMELFYNQFLNYGKKSAIYIADKHDMSKEYCSMYIASGLYMLMLNRIEQLKENENDLKLIQLKAFFGTLKLVKKVMAITNYSSYFKNNEYAYNNGDNTLYKMPKYKKSKNQYNEYRNIKKVNSHVIDIIDILEQKENRTHKKELSIDSDSEYDFRNNIVSYYPTPEQALLNKLSRFYSKRTADKIRHDKKYARFIELSEKNLHGELLENKDIDFMYNFKKRNNLSELSSKEVFYIVSNY